MTPDRPELVRRMRDAGMSERAIRRWWTVHNPVLEAVPEAVWPDRADEVADAVDRLVDPHGHGLLSTDDSSSA